MSNYSLSQLLPWLSIRSKLIIAFVGLSIVPLGLVGLYSIFSNAKIREQIALENLTHDVHTIRENTANFLRNIETDLRVLRNAHVLKTQISLFERPVDGKNDKTILQLKSELVAFAETKQLYYQIRIIKNDGDELLRIEPHRETVTGLTFHAVRQNELRCGRETFYHLLTENLGKNQIASFASELVDENNFRIPVISFAMPLIGSRRNVGILIANVFAKDLFRVIETKRHLDVNGNVILVSKDGHFLYHSEKKKDWNKLLASREEDKLQHDYPMSIVQILLSGKEGTVTEGIDEIISFGPLFSFSADAGTAAAPSFSVPFYVLESVPKHVILAPVRSFTITFAIFLGGFLIVSIALGLLATRQFTKPIAELHQGAEIISRGNYGHRLLVDTHDEIEKLANQFNMMAASLESHEKEIQLHRTKLEEMVKQRTAELSEEKVKLQAILDHVPSAIVLIDREFRIQSASAAFSKITGHRFEEVRGSDCKTAFSRSGFCRECVCREAMETGKIESHIDHSYDGTMRERFIEHIAIPMIENGTVGSILEIITDITERKRLEQNLLRTERLAAAGEMSAIIAHEFRNSLTSIKMILQLQSESQQLQSSERKSLGVALSSIEEMEKVVTELLEFARPKPFQFKPSSLNDNIDDSITFASPQFTKHGISIKKNLDPALPKLFMDESRMKEAIINILLNAIHALTVSERSFGNGYYRATPEIRLDTAQVFVHKTIRDFASFKHEENPPDKDTGSEVVIKKGASCAVVIIKDSGCGIEPENLSRIFDPFFTTKTNGTGLGLPLVKRTINAHGGIIMVNSKKGEGTSFTIYLPYDR